MFDIGKNHWYIWFPGCICPEARVVWFLLFLILTVVQTYLSLQLEEAMAENPKYPKTIPT